LALHPERRRTLHDAADQPRRTAVPDAMTISIDPWPTVS
jgi:hypothetical protein